MPRPIECRWCLAVFAWASLAGEVIAWIAFGLLLAIVVVALNPSLAHGDPFENRWPTPAEQFVAPNPFGAASFLNTWDVVTNGAEAPPEPPPHLTPRIDPPPPGLMRCHSQPGDSGTFWMWREIDGRRCWYVGRKLVAKSRLRWK